MKAFLQFERFMSLEQKLNTPIFTLSHVEKLEAKFRKEKHWSDIVRKKIKLNIPSL